MKIVNINYLSVPEFTDPEAWLARVDFTTGIWEELAKKYQFESLERINFSGQIKKNGVLYHFTHFKKRKYYFPVRLHRVVKKMKPDIVFVNSFIFPFQLIQLRLKLGRSVKIIVINRSEKPFQGYRRYLQKLADKCVDAYLFPSSEAGDSWINNGNIKDRKKIYEAMHGSSYFQKKDKSEARNILSVNGSPVFLWVGRLNANKDPITVVKAFIEYLKIQPLAKLYMIYHTDELLNNVKEMIQDDHANDSIFLIGKIPHKEMQNWYNASDFIISGSHYEGGGLAVCEAMSCGCIPILTDIVSFRRFTGPGICGMLYKPGDDTELLEILKKTQQVDKEKESGLVLEQFRKELSFEAIGRKIHNAISSLY